MSFMRTIRPALDRARYLPASLGRTARWPMALGALLLTASTASVVATANTPPKILSASVSPQIIDEGQAAVLTLSFADADPGDSHTIRVKWHDTPGASSGTEVHQLPPQQTSIQLPHTFRDSSQGPSGKVQVTLYDRQTPPGSPNDNSDGAAQDVIFVPITVRNVAPGFTGPIAVTPSRVSPTQVKVKIDGTIADVARDTHQVRAAKWYGSTVAKVTTPCTANSLHFHCELTYALRELRSMQSVTVYVKDDEGAEGSTVVTVPGQDEPSS